MAKQGEIDYLRNIGQDGIRHAVHKPFSDPECGKYLSELGAVFTLLPPPPARLLDIGCGTGWTSRFFAKRGYEVVGIDIAPDMVFHAQEAAQDEGLTNLSFQACDYEDVTFREEFDCAVFFDSLHHAVDEQQAVVMAFRALKPGGICVTSEPGTGHGSQPGSLAAVQRFGVTEKDMPPKRIVQLGKKAGFKTFRIVPHAFDINVAVFKAAVDMPAENYSTDNYRKHVGQTCSYVLSVLDDSGMVRMVK
ncbi:MAG TPA: class I SAM-dependent methyltransferase [Gemmataceae bacterium]|nr:class I SAM-dependent methyltransferase [Gemmataceae bacterium]